jgi:MinD-like ATPase involved in chromosome partitioning or flagellar assembly
LVPDRNDHTPDVNDDENGVLADTGSIDTTGIGIFGSTEHVSVSMPVGSQDDELDSDDAVDIVADEIAVDDLEVEPVHAAHALDGAPADEPPADETAHEAVVEDVVDAEIVTDDIVDAEIVDEEPEEEQGAGAAPGDESHGHADAHGPADAQGDADAHGDAHAYGDAESYEAATDAEEPAEPDAEVENPEEAGAEQGARADAAHHDENAATGLEPAIDEEEAVIDEADAADDAPAVVEAETDETLIVIDEAVGGDDADDYGSADAEDAYAAFAAAGFDVRGLAMDDFDDDVEDESIEAGDVDGGSAHTEEAAPEATGAVDVAPGETGADDEGALVDEVKPVTDPLTRSALRQAMTDDEHAGGADHAPDADRVHETERIAVVRQEVALTSKRYGEFEPDRESADLLTADRLLDHSRVGRTEPEGAWQQFVYSISGRRINLGDSKRARARKELDRRISAPLAGGARFVPVLSRKGGVGKTTITTLLGMALADARDDRVIAIDGNPDRGTLAERISRPSGRTVRDLARLRDSVNGFNDISSIVARDETRLDAIASDADPHVSEAFSDHDYRDVATIAAHYYSIVLTDTGTGIVHSVMGATLDMADEIVIVSGLAVDEARLASETLTWLETNGFTDKVRKAVVVLNNARPGSPLVLPDELEAHFRSRVRAVVRMPYDPHIGAGSAIAFRELQPETREAARQLAAIVVEGLRSLDAAA